MAIETSALGQSLHQLEMKPNRWKNRILYGLLLNHLELGNASLAGKGKSGNRNPKSKQIFPTDFGGDMGHFPKDTVGDLFVHHVCHTTCLVMLHRGKLRAHASDLRWKYVKDVKVN